ncbi:MAG TPA: hypothetical protein VM681_10995 [Candidatus Thermoplasmatota archaeon]|nr:hypothetical protein [Candidatus Thermoplasmatota archaeon]
MVYEETERILAVITTRVSSQGRLYLKKYRGRPVRILVLLDDPNVARPFIDGRRRL